MSQLSIHLRQAQDWVRRERHLILLVVAAFGFFIRHFHVQVLDPTNVAWLMQHDWGQHALGLHAFLHSDWGLPLTHTDLFFSPEGANVALTDSNPLLALPLKLVSWALPRDFQVIGPWLLSCVILQALVGYLLIRTYASGKLVAAFAALVFLMWPPLWFRMDHDTLMAQWIILLGLWAYVTPGDGWVRSRRFLLAFGLSALIHPFLFLMVAAIWGGEMLRLGWTVLQRRSLEDWRPLAFMACAPPGLSMAIFFLTGVLPGGSGASWGYTEYSMNLNSPLNSKDAYASVFLDPLPMGMYQYEGFAYLGVGLMVLLAIATGLALWSRHQGAMEIKASPSTSPSLAWQAAPMVFLVLMALSTKARLGDIILWDIPIPDHMRDVTLGAVRASGRFIWPVAYLVLFMALRTVLKRPLVIAAPVLAVVMVVQQADLWVYSAAQHTRSGWASELDGFQKARSPKWAQLAAQADAVVFIPATVPRDRTLFYEIAWQAVGQGRSVNTMYMSRTTSDQIKAETQSMSDFLRNGADDRVLYVFHEGCNHLGGTRNGLAMLDDVIIRPPLAAAELALSPLQEICP